MPVQTSQPIIIIRRKKGHGGGHHGGAWKVAYADFVTAMLALFIVLWLLSSSEQIQKAVGGYFTDPKGKGKDIGNGLRGSGSESLSIRKDDMNKLKEKLEQAVKDSTSLQKIKEHVIFTVTGEGLRVELLEGEDSTFFESGNSRPTDFGKDLLKKLAEEIGKLPNRVTMEGHTDSRPFPGGADYTNWELSSDRANAARRWMQQNGMRDDQVTQVRGFADQSPRDPVHPDDAKNRRVTLVIMYQAAKPQTPPEAPPPTAGALPAAPTIAPAGGPPKPPNVSAAAITQKPGASPPGNPAAKPSPVPPKT
jgi:chemotaxis protein MotB